MSKVLTLVVLFFVLYGFWKVIRGLWRNADIDEQKETVVSKEGQFDDVKKFMKKHKIHKSFKERMARFFG